MPNEIHIIEANGKKFKFADNENYRCFFDLNKEMMFDEIRQRDLRSIPMLTEVVRIDDKDRIAILTSAIGISERPASIIETADEVFFDELHAEVHIPLSKYTRYEIPIDSNIEMMLLAKYNGLYSFTIYPFRSEIDTIAFQAYQDKMGNFHFTTKDLVLYADKIFLTQCFEKIDLLNTEIKKHNKRK
jgi:hypothetical protein